VKFDHKIYRCEWQIVIQDVDQYGKNVDKKKLITALPTYEQAFDKMSEYGREHEYVKGRWIPHNPDHAYQFLEIQYKEVQLSAINGKKLLDNQN
jgi:hypothetical protein